MPRALRSTVYFRADGNARLGLGHVVRCLALADMLAPRFAGVLVLREPDAVLEAQAAAAQCRVLVVPAALSDAQEEAAWVSRLLQPTDLLVLDGYQFGPPYQAVVSNNHFGLVCIDDLVTVPAWADAVLNQAGGVLPGAYAAAPGARLLLGPAYALLRRPFRQLTAPPAQRPWTGRVFLSMGGADPGNQTAALLPQLAQAFPGHALDVVTGAAYPHRAALAAVAARLPQVRLHHNVAAAPLAALLRTCDLLVCPPSGMAYECATAGGLLLLHPTAANQQGMFAFLVGAGLALPLAALGALMPADWPGRAAQMRARQAELFDGRATGRLTAAFEELHAAAALHLRRATAADCALYFGWANDPAVRRNAIHPEPIAWPSHQAWFAQRLAARDAYQLVIELAGEPVGQVRVEFDGSVGLIDYAVAAAHRGQGLGARLLRRALHWLRHQRPGPWVLRGEVWADNLASARVFEGLRFARRPAVLRNGRTFEVFELAVNSGL